MHNGRSIAVAGDAQLVLDAAQQSWTSIISVHANCAVKYLHVCQLPGLPFSFVLQGQCASAHSYAATLCQPCCGTSVSSIGRTWNIVLWAGLQDVC